MTGGLGATPGPGGTRFRVWAPGARSVEVMVEAPPRRAALEPGADGVHEVLLPGVGAGARYRLSMDGGPAWPDPASRFQPEGVHGPSEVVDPRAFAWSDHAWRGLPRSELVLYELHVGTFTPEGTFAAAARRLPDLRDLGVTAVQLMPVADFPGACNWGYDGAALYAPARCYGTPDDLRRLVDTAHRLGLAVLLDVVYNHFGPDGAYVAAFSPQVLARHHRSPWGAGIDLDGPHARGVREWLIGSALHWIGEYHLDGLRLDATHALVDKSPRHFLAELTERVRARAAGREVHVIAEDARNLDTLLRPAHAGGFALDAVWADDFHHELRRLVAGDAHGYFAAFRGHAEDLAGILRRGWHYCGQHSVVEQGPRGTDPAGLAPEQFVFCIQNHDQVGNRPLGDRLHHRVPPEAYRAAVALLLFAPQTPLLFMGQEWAASSPFLFFTDHAPGLGRRVTEGRLQEFRSFPAFAHEAAEGRLPDPQARATFEASRLDWDERVREPHAAALRLHRALLTLRRTAPALQRGPSARHEAHAAGAGAVVLRREAGGGPPLIMVARLAGEGTVEVPAALLRGSPAEAWAAVLGTEASEFAADPRPPRRSVRHGTLAIEFERPGAVVLSPPANPAPAA